MGRTVVAGLALAMVVVAGCQQGPPPADNTAAVCDDMTRLQQSPQMKALDEALVKAYEGSGDPAASDRARKAAYQVLADGMRALAAKATRPELKEQLTALADAFRADDSTAVAAALGPLSVTCASPGPA